MQHLLTAVVREHPVFGVRGESEVFVLRLDLSDLRVREVRTTIICGVRLKGQRGEDHYHLWGQT